MNDIIYEGVVNHFTHNGDSTCPGRIRSIGTRDNPDYLCEVLHDTDEWVVLDDDAECARLYMEAMHAFRKELEFI